MKDKGNPFLTLQAAYFDALRAYMRIGADFWRTAWDDYQKLYHPQPHRRGEDVHKQAPCAEGGARLAHKYGKRAHDVDVEHI